ncbi:MAG TPA: hypothetical protein PKA00_13750 [Saprospiraceae bacterium]|nr:hypothetical protein [Saprospiraceae bacterium]HMQ83975.1 hypothetical protein [Saprospiraceae bacterium]
MRNNTWIITGILAWFVLTAANAQNQIIGKSIPELKATTPLALPTPHTYTSFYLFQMDLLPMPAMVYSRRQKIPTAYAYKDLGVFCQLDVRLERKAGFPIKFRLGEVQYVEKMEGK